MASKPIFKIISDVIIQKAASTSTSESEYDLFEKIEFSDSHTSSASSVLDDIVRDAAVKMLGCTQKPTEETPAIQDESNDEVHLQEKTPEEDDVVFNTVEVLGCTPKPTEESPAKQDEGNDEEEEDDDDVVFNLGI